MRRFPRRRSDAGGSACAGGVRPGHLRRCPAMRGVSLALLVVLAVAVSASGCRPPERPSLDAWEPVWRRAAGLMENVSGLEAAGEPRRRCNETLVALRELEVELLRTPHPLLDEAVQEWFHSAESTVFECALAKGQPEAFAERLRVTSILADEVGVVLADLRG